MRNVANARAGVGISVVAVGALALAACSTTATSDSADNQASPGASSSPTAATGAGGVLVSNVPGAICHPAKSSPYCPDPGATFMPYPSATAWAAQKCNFVKLPDGSTPPVPAYAIPKTPPDPNLNGGVLPDPACTNGALQGIKPMLDPIVTQDNLPTTICQKGFTTTDIRPTTRYTTPEKLNTMVGYGLNNAPKSNADDYEFDHFVPLTLGGAPDAVQNLWNQPHDWLATDGWGSDRKDRLEAELGRRICLAPTDPNFVALIDAQTMIATNWPSAYYKIFGNDGTGKAWAAGEPRTRAGQSDLANATEDGD